MPLPINRYRVQLDRQQVSLIELTRHSAQRKKIWLKFLPKMLKWTKRKSNRWKGWFFKSLRNFLWGWRTASLSYNRLSKALSNFVPSGPGSALIENSYLFLVPGKLWENEEEKKVFFNEDDSLQLQSQNKSNFVFRYGTSLELVYEITTSLTKYRERDSLLANLLCCCFFWPCYW